MPSINARAYASWLTPPQDESGVWHFGCDAKGCPERGTLYPFTGKDYDEAADSAAATCCDQCGAELLDEEDIRGEDYDDE